MKTIANIKSLRAELNAHRLAGKTIGLVPTMGFLHEGHLSLIRQACAHADIVVVSIFVNPTQFGPTEDLDSYPRDFEHDEAACREAGADFIFYPEASAMYRPDASVFVNEEHLSTRLCGAKRAGHFRGVLTVVCKLFNIVQPDLAVFGRKDAQQLRLIQQMVRDLDIPVQVLSGEIVREPNGLAMSSRNNYLSSEQRRDAAGIQQALQLAQIQFDAGERDAAVLRRLIENRLNAIPDSRIDYIELVAWSTLQPIDLLDTPTLVAVAVFVGATRLIDNRLLANENTSYSS